MYVADVILRPCLPSCVFAVQLHLDGTSPSASAQVWAATEKGRYEEKGKVWSKFAGRMGMPTAAKIAEARMDWSFTESPDLQSQDSETPDGADVVAVEQSHFLNLSATIQLGCGECCCNSNCAIERSLYL